MKFKSKLNDHATEVSVFDTTETVVPLADAAAACSESQYSKQKLHFVGQKHDRPTATTMPTNNDQKMHQRWNGFDPFACVID